MLNRLLTVNDIRLQSSSTAVSTFLPFDQNCRRLPTQLVIRATGNGAFVRLSDDRSDATNADLLVQPGDHVVVAVAQRRWVSMLPVSGSTTVSFGALSTGVGRAVASVDPFAQTGPALDLVFAGVPSDLLSPSYTLTTDFVAPQYEIGAQYAIWDDSGLVQKNFADIVTFTRASTATYFNSAGTLTSAAVDEARFDYNPSTLAAQGLLIEEARTNSIRNNTMVGAVAGTPGTLPTNWTSLGIGLGTLTQQVVGTGTTNGIDYIDYRVSGTTSTTGFTLSFEQAAQIVAVNGQTWASSAWASLIGGSTTNINALNLAIDGRTAAGAFVGVVNGLNLLGVTPTLTRYTSTGTIANASVERVVLGIAFGFASGVAIDITLRIGLPQLEQGAFATSVIPTTTTALTRSADVASVNTLSPWYNASAGTLYVQGILVGGTAATFPYQSALVGSNANNDSIGVNWGANAGTMRWGVRVGAASQADLNAGSGKSAGSSYKVAGRYATNDFQVAVDGTLGTPDTTGSLPTITALSLGGPVSFQPGASVWLQRVTYYPRPLANADLQAITT